MVVCRIFFLTSYNVEIIKLSCKIIETKAKEILNAFFLSLIGVYFDIHSQFAATFFRFTYLTVPRQGVPNPWEEIDLAETALLGAWA